MGKGYRYRKNYKKLPGSPDIVLTKYKIAIFCDGEFFHGKDWEVLKPRLEKGNNSEFWISKISRNRERDDEINKRLLFEGWTVIRFWGDDIKKHTDECVKIGIVPLKRTNCSRLFFTDLREPEKPHWRKSLRKRPAQNLCRSMRLPPEKRIWKL